MIYKYKTKGTCSSAIHVELEGNIVKHVHFDGGCNGNLTCISKMVEGMTVENVIEKLSGIKCGFKKTSCPDQLACALSEAFSAQK